MRCTDQRQYGIGQQQHVQKQRQEIAEQRRQAHLESLPPAVCYCQLLTASNHLAAAYEELRAYDIVSSSVPPVPLRILTR